MISPKALVDALNAADYRVFPQRNNKEKTTQSFQAEDGKRYFITRVATNHIGAEGKPVYIWAVGKPMRELQTAK